eukprot:767579-Hanusia_phi.AAC.2
MDAHVKEMLKKLQRDKGRLFQIKVLAPLVFCPPHLSMADCLEGPGNIEGGGRTDAAVVLPHG